MRIQFRPTLLLLLLSVVTLSNCEKDPASGAQQNDEDEPLTIRRFFAEPAEVWSFTIRALACALWARVRLYVLDASDGLS